MASNKKIKKIVPNAYVYETSPKKLAPSEYIPPKQKKNEKIILQM